MVEMNKSKTTKIAQKRLWFLHWLMASFYLLLFIGGTYMIHLGRNTSYKSFLYDFHKTLGVIVMSLLLARIFILLRVQLNKTHISRKKNWMQRLIVHTFLYLFMLVVPFTGYLLSNAGGHDIIIVGTNIVLPQLFVTNKYLAILAGNLHFWLSYTFLMFIFLHTSQQWKYLQGIWRRLYKVA